VTNKFYAPGAKRGARVGDLFATIAPRYDLINDLQSFGLHRLWKRRLVRLAGASPARDALDLCCGTGDVAFALARRGVKAVGLDFSEPMLQVAMRRRQNDRSNPRISGVQFVRGDALHVPFPDRCFDLVTISYGLRNLADLDAGMAEILRVLRPGGRFLSLEFGKPDSPAWRWFYFGYLKHFVPVLGRWFCGDSETHSYILESLTHFPDQHEVASRLRNTGFQNVEVIHLLAGIMGIHVAQKPG
jgi:demethylmenaquinone methyltransferase/2-methoxy-6-polyprenyl-1,4-benzoquinol methylase